MRRNNVGHLVLGAMIALALCAAEPALGQQDNSQSGGSQMPPDQGTAPSTSQAAPLQPSEIQEQQIEQQQQTQNPGD